jgi:hypothetical protein
MGAQHSRGKPKGLPKSGGRKKGTPNRVTQDFRNRLEELGFDPIQGAIDLFNDLETPPDIRFRCIYFLAEFSFYKPKNPLDLPGAQLPPPPRDATEGMSDEDLDDALRQKKAAAERG